MKKLFVIFLTCNLLVPLYAAKVKRAKKFRVRHKAPRQSVSQLSARANLSLERRMNQIIKLTNRTVTNVPRKGHPLRTTFQVQPSNVAFGETASAFAIKLNGKTWGVTAAHVMRNIRPKPHIKVEVSPHNFKIAPIEKFFVGNPAGADIALFEIPEEVKPHVTVLEPAKQPANMGEKVSIPGFAAGQPLFIANEKILFSNSMRLFIQRTPLEDLTGFCGSPIFGKNNTVLGVYSGFVKKSLLYEHSWFYDIPWEIRDEIPNLHFAIPVENLEIMAKAAEKNSLQAAGKMMKVFDHPIAPLHLNEYILSVEQFRNGEMIAKVHKNLIVEPKKLEQFFELQENDVLRVILSRPQTKEAPTPYVIYDVNVTTGKVTEVSEKEAFTPIWGR